MFLDRLLFELSCENTHTHIDAKNTHTNTDAKHTHKHTQTDVHTHTYTHTHAHTHTHTQLFSLQPYNNSYMAVLFVPCFILVLLLELLFLQINTKISIINKLT